MLRGYGIGLSCKRRQAGENVITPDGQKVRKGDILSNISHYSLNESV